MNGERDILREEIEALWRVRHVHPRFREWLRWSLKEARRRRALGKDT